MEPISWSVIAGLATTLIVKPALTKAGETVGEKLGEAVVERSSDSVKPLHRTIHNNLQTSGTAGLLKRAEDKPTERNIEILEGELISQLEEDAEFATQLQELIQQIQTQSPSLQTVLDSVRIGGNADVRDIEQTSANGSSEQIIGRNLGVKGDLRIGNITQKTI